tara:strand:- start:162 stop:758 length:597 start_codon:yes stop_codon:yes gene_type:complete
MKNNSILVIGNGESVLNYNYGTIINNYSTVLRINNYKLKGYENQVGTKTDIWFNGANSKLKKPNSIPNKIIVAIPSSIIIKKESELTNYVSKRLKLHENKFSLIPINQIKKYEELVRFNRLTTGLYSILWAIDNYEEVTIHGFDFFINSKSHYYNSKLTSILKKYFSKKGYKHNNDLELNFVNKMIMKKKIKKIDISD